MMTARQPQFEDNSHYGNVTADFLTWVRNTPTARVRPALYEHRLNGVFMGDNGITLFYDIDALQWDRSIDITRDLLDYLDTSGNPRAANLDHIVVMGN